MGGMFPNVARNATARHFHSSCSARLAFKLLVGTCISLSRRLLLVGCFWPERARQLHSTFTPRVQLGRTFLVGVCVFLGTAPSQGGMFLVGSCNFHCTALSLRARVQFGRSVVPGRRVQLSLRGAFTPRAQLSWLFLVGACVFLLVHGASL